MKMTTPLLIVGLIVIAGVVFLLMNKKPAKKGSLNSLVGKTTSATPPTIADTIVEELGISDIGSIGIADGLYGNVGPTTQAE